MDEVTYVRQDIARLTSLLKEKCTEIENKALVEKLERANRELKRLTDEKADK